MDYYHLWPGEGNVACTAMFEEKPEERDHTVDLVVSNTKASRHNL